MNNSKIQLSTEEMQLVTNSHWILTKHRIIEKVYLLFGAIAAEMQSSIKQELFSIPGEVLQLPPKISKGEQYEGLPYVVLDYPRYFSRENVFAIRSFFWWGNYFSSTLHLKGKFQQQFADKIMRAINNKQADSYYLSISGDEFNFNINAKNYKVVAKETGIDPHTTDEFPFYKITYTISFEHWDAAHERLMEAFKNFTGIICS